MSQIVYMYEFDGQLLADTGVSKCMRNNYIEWPCLPHIQVQSMFFSFASTFIEPPPHTKITGRHMSNVLALT